MASAKGIRAGAAYIELFVNDSKLLRGLRSAQKRLQAFGSMVSGWGRTLATAGAAITAPLLGSAKAFSEMGDRIAKASARTGISVETLSELAYAADLSGASLDVFEGSVRRMQRAIVEAADGSQTMVDALAALGLKAEDFAGLSTDQQFKLIADRLSQIQSPAVKAALAMELFGRSGTQLLPLMAEGAAGIEALQAQARSLGLTMSTEDAKAAEALNDAFDTLWKVIRQGVFTIGSALAPMLQRASEWISRTVATTTEWMKANKQLVVTLFKVAAVVVAGGVALIGLGISISLLGTILGGVAGVISGVVVVFKVLIGVLAAILSPIGLVIAAVTALGAYLIYASGTGGQALQWLADRFADLSAFAAESFGAIADALRAGDIALAARILWLSLSVLWQKGVLELTRLWEGLKRGSLKIVSGLWYGALAAWEIGVASISQLMLKLYYAVMDIWQRLSTGVANVWDSTVNWVAKRIVDLWGLVDETLDTDAIQRSLDADADRRIGQRNREKDAAVEQIAAEREAALQMLQQEHQQNLGRIGQASLDADQQLDAESQQKIDAAQRQLEQAKREWEEAIGQARQSRPPAGGEGPERLTPAPDLADYLENLGPAIDLAKERTVGARGSFSALEARGLGAGGVTDRIAKASEETAKNTKRLVQEAQLGGLVFE